MTPGFSGSLRTKLLAVIVVTTMVALAVALCAMIIYDLRLYRDKAIAELETQAELLGRASEPALQFDDPKAALENAQLLRFRPEIEAAAIYDARGAIFAKYAANAGQNCFRVKLDQKPDDQGLPVTARLTFTGGSGPFETTVAFGEPVGQ